MPSQENIEMADIDLNDVRMNDLKNVKPIDMNPKSGLIRKAVEEKKL
jgi:hypothetical protein